jgi:glycosyltransferase involved in cell wall biosynthesis
MRVLWYSPAPYFGSGYGVATKHLAGRLMDRGHEVLIFAPTQNGTQPVTWQRYSIVGVYAQAYGTDVLMSHVHSFQPDVVLVLYDQWVLGSWQDLLGTLYLPWVVGHYEPMEPELYKAVRKTWRQLAMSEWGARVMREAGLSPRVVPLGVDTNLFRPVVGLLDDNGRVIDKTELKKAVGAFDDEFLVGMVAANVDFRKNLEAQLRVFADFNRKYPDTRLFLKTNPSSAAGGWDINRLLGKLCGLSADRPVGPVSYPATDLAEASPEQMVLWYNAMDVYLGCAVSEGYGLPIAEANACGVPAIVTDFSAMPEVGYGWHIPGTRELNVLYSFHVRPDEQRIWDALEEAYKMRGTPRAAEMSAAARQHALRFDWDLVAEKLDKELESWYLDRPL